MNIYVSVASIFDKQHVLIKALHSIANQKTKPCKCFINLSEEPNILDKGFKDRKMSEALNRYIESNDLFQINWVKNTGPFVKLLPVLKEKMLEDCVIITIDDDSEYESNMIDDYLAAYNKYKCVVCSRSFNMDYTNVGEMKYGKRKKLAISENPSIKNFHSGKGGVLYHPTFFAKSFDHIFDENIYLKCCPHNDDVWFNLHRIANNVKCYAPQKTHTKVDNSVYQFALWDQYNSKNNNNDKQIKDTYETMIKLGYSL